MEATRLSNTKGLSVPLDYASTILARVEAERDALRAENARIKSALQDACVFLSLAADRGVLDGEEVSSMIDDYQAAIKGEQ